MRRRSQKTETDATAPGDAAVETVAGAAAGRTPPSGPWEEWGDSEAERVARWLQSMVRPEIEVIEDAEPSSPAFELGPFPGDDSRRTLHTESRYEAEMWRLDQQRRRLAVEVDAERAQAERARREQLDAWARLESEMSELDEKRRRLADAVEAERSEVERVRHEQNDARARLESAVGELDQQRQRLLAVEAERSEAERVRQEHVEARAALQAEVDAIDEQRRRLVAAVEAERSEAERARRAHADARARLEAEMAELDQQRRRLVDAVEAERAEVERVRMEQLDAKSRLQAEVTELDRQRQALLASMEADRAEAARIAAEHAEVARAAAAQASTAEAQTARAQTAQAEAEQAVAAAEQARAELAQATEKAAAARRDSAAREAAERTAAEQARRAPAPPVTTSAGAGSAAGAGPAVGALSGAGAGPAGRDGGADARPTRPEPAGTRVATPGPGRRMHLVPATDDASAARVSAIASAHATPEEGDGEARARLASAVADLARHVATTHADERIDAGLVEQLEREAEARRRTADAAAGEQRRRAAEALVVARTTGRRRSRKWVWRSALAVAVLVPIAIDVRTPIVARAHLRDAARSAVDSAAVEFSANKNVAQARQVAEGVADLEGVALVQFTIDGPVLRITVSDRADSLVLGKVASGWYELEASASSTALVTRAESP